VQHHESHVTAGSWRSPKLVHVTHHNRPHGFRSRSNSLKLSMRCIFLVGKSTHYPHRSWIGEEPQCDFGRGSLHVATRSPHSRANGLNSYSQLPNPCVSTPWNSRFCGRRSRFLYTYSGLMRLTSSTTYHSHSPAPKHVESTPNLPSTGNIHTQRTTPAKSSGTPLGQPRPWAAYSQPTTVLFCLDLHLSIGSAASFILNTCRNPPARVLRVRL